MAPGSKAVLWAAALTVAVLAFPAAAEDWQAPPVNAARCQNNMARYNEITAQLAALKRLSVQDLTEARGKLVFSRTVEGRFRVALTLPAERGES